MREYIENWLKQALIKIIEDDQVEVFGTSHATIIQDNLK